ncbi:MAG: microcystin-dependent protein [Neolewinella sp.]|jgi:microcystin-dependent protein
MQAFIGQIQLFGCNFAPRGWAQCNGQLLSITQHQTLFSLLGTIYGGDGRTTFALPDLRSRVPVGDGQSPGLSSIRQGSQFGSEVNYLTTQQLPSHTHGLSQGKANIPVSTEDADQDEANGKFLANGSFYHNSPGGTYGNGPIPISGNTDPSGGNQSVPNIQPSLGSNYCIALDGFVYPSRS